MSRWIGSGAPSGYSKMQSSLPFSNPVLIYFSHSIILERESRVVVESVDSFQAVNLTKIRWYNAITQADDIIVINPNTSFLFLYFSFEKISAGISSSNNRSLVAEPFDNNETSVVFLIGWIVCISLRETFSNTSRLLLNAFRCSILWTLLASQ